MIKAVLVFLLIYLSAFGLTDIQKEKLLKVIQGAYRDKIYSIAITKSKEYINQTEPDAPYREDVYKILMYSLYKENKKEEFWKYLKKVEKENIKDREYFYKLGINLFKDQPDKLEYFYKALNKKLPEDRKNQIEKALAISYVKEKKWEKILSLPKRKSINLYRIIALYKLGRYKDVIKETDKLGNFLPDDKDKVLYFRGLAFYKLGNEKKAVSTIEAITFKTPEMLQFLANYYLKKKKYLYAERYLKILSTDKEFKSYAYYYLGVIEDLQKRYDKAISYYKKASIFKDKYGKLAKERLSVLEKYLPVYSIRLILLSTKEKAESFLKKIGLKNCFIKKYKNLYGVYCGKFFSRDKAEKFQKQLKEKGFDTYIQKLNP